MVSFGSIDFNQLKGHNPVMASGPNAWVPRRHRFVWRSELQPDKDAYHQILLNYNTLVSGNVLPMSRGQMNHFRDNSEEPVYINDVNLNSVRKPVWRSSHDKRPVQFSIKQNPAFMPSWNLFNHKARKAGCGSCGGRR